MEDNHVHPLVQVDWVEEEVQHQVQILLEQLIQVVEVEVVILLEQMAVQESLLLEHQELLEYP